MIAHIRWIIRRDMPEVLAIERQLTDGSWTEEDWIHVLRQRNCIGMVAELNGVVAGIMAYELKGKHVVILHLAVDLKFRRLGVGRALIDKLKSKLSNQRRRFIYAGVDERDLDAQLFLRAEGFQAVGTEDDRYLFRYDPTGIWPGTRNRIAKYFVR